MAERSVGDDMIHHELLHLNEFVWSRGWAIAETLKLMLPPEPKNFVYEYHIYIVPLENNLPMAAMRNITMVDVNNRERFLSLLDKTIDNAILGEL
jgi:hypothetical protein